MKDDIIYKENNEISNETMRNITPKQERKMKKRILIVTNHSYMFWQFRKELVEALQKEHEVILAMPFVGHEEDFRKMGIECIPVSMNRRGVNPFAEAKLLRDYKRLLQKISPDFVLTYSIKPNIYMGLLCSCKKIPYYANVQGLGTAYIMLHNMMISRGAKTVLWGCSINPEVLSNPEIVNDVRQYQLITARESITYNALKKINPNTILVADPAFGLKTAYAEIPSKFINKNMVGINLSPMVQKEEKISGIIMKNYEILIEHILKETDMAIALIPHVIWDDSDDRIPLMQLYERYKKSGRVLVIEDQNCSKLKYAISKCRFFVGARTHSTIAAYSSGIPTLVVGYSVKARGIARDLFGDEEQYSLSVQRLKETDELLKKFRWILENEELIKKQLNSKIPEVIKRALTAKEYVERLL